MSKFVKDLVTDRSADASWTACRTCCWSTWSASTANHTSALRKQLRQKNIKLDGGQEQPGPAGDRGHAAGGGVRGLARHAGHGLGRRRHRLAGQGSRASWPATRSSKPFAPRGGVMDGASCCGRRSRAGQQVAQPRGATQHAGGPDPLARAPGWSSQLIGAGGALASQIKQKSEGAEEEAAPASAAPRQRAAAEAAAARGRECDECNGELVTR